MAKAQRWKRKGKVEGKREKQHNNLILYWTKCHRCLWRWNKNNNNKHIYTYTAHHCGLLNAILLPSSSSKAYQYVFNIKSADATHEHNIQANRYVVHCTLYTTIMHRLTAHALVHTHTSLNGLSSPQSIVYTIYHTSTYIHTYIRIRTYILFMKLAMVIACFLNAYRYLIKFSVANSLAHMEHSQTNDW